MDIKAGYKMIEHESYTEHGRKFKVTDSKTGQKVYKTAVGQLNVLEGKDYKPYIWDSSQNTCRFNDYEIKLTSTGVEFWEEGTKLIGFGAHPEIEKVLTLSDFERKETTVSGLAVVHSVTQDATDKIEISYDVETDDLKSRVSFEVGGRRTITFGCELTAKVLDKLQRLTLEFDQEAILEKPGRFDSGKRYVFKDGQSYWKWPSIEDADHTETITKDKLEVHLKEQVYTSINPITIKPDTWGPTNTSDDCLEVEDSTYVDHSGGYVGLGQESGDVIDTGAHFVVTDADMPGATIDNGTKLIVTNPIDVGTVQGVLKICDDRAVGAWGAANRPSQHTKHPDTVEADPNGSSTQDSPEMKTLVQARIDGDDVADPFESGDTMSIVWEDDGSNNGNYFIWTEETVDFTIVYTPAPVGGNAPTGTIYGALVGPIGGPI